MVLLPVCRGPNRAMIRSGGSRRRAFRVESCARWYATTRFQWFAGQPRQGGEEVAERPGCGLAALSARRCLTGKRDVPGSVEGQVARQYRDPQQGRLILLRIVDCREPGDPHFRMERTPARCPHAMHTRLQHRVQRTRGTRDPDAGLVDEYVHPVAGVAESLMKPHRIGQQLLHALVLVGKNRERQHKQCLQIQRVGGEHGEIEPVPVRRTDQFEGHGARVRRQHRPPCPGADRSEAAGRAPSGSPCAPRRLPAASPAGGWRSPAVPAPV